MDLILKYSSIFVIVHGAVTGAFLWLRKEDVIQRKRKNKGTFFGFVCGLILIDVLCIVSGMAYSPSQVFYLNTAVYYLGSFYMCCYMLKIRFWEKEGSVLSHHKIKCELIMDLAIGIVFLIFLIYPEILEDIPQELNKFVTELSKST